MSSMTPLCLLLEGLWSQDRSKVQNAMRLVKDYWPQAQTICGGQSPEENVYLIVRVLLKSNSRLAAVPCEEEGSLPLHYAAALGYVEVARALLNAFPGGASYPNRKGKIPLHFAAREGRTSMVYMLTEAHPETAQIASKKAKLALHFAVSEGHLAIVECLLECYPEGALKRSSKGKFPLHFACRWGHMTIARKLSALHPESVRELDGEGSLPLHDASRQGQVAMCKFLMEMYPEGLAISSLRGEIPLFSAVRSGNLDLVICLVQAWPRGALYVLQNLSEHDSVETWSPVILELCLRGASFNFTECDVLHGRHVPVLCDLDHVTRTEGYAAGDSEKQQARVAVKGDSLAEDDSTSNLKRTAGAPPPPDELHRSKRMKLVDELPRPETRRFLTLHTALESSTNTQVLRYALIHHRDQVTQQDSCGQLPLHLAMTHCRDDESVQLVLDDMLTPHPESSMVKDHQGRLPLHVGLVSRADFRLIRGVVEANPLLGETELSVRGEGKHPLLVASANDCDLSTVYFLLRYDPSVIRLA